VVDKSGANYAGFENINFILLLAGWLGFIEIIQGKYLTILLNRIIASLKRSLNR
jgi:putative transposase